MKGTKSDQAFGHSGSTFDSFRREEDAIEQHCAAYSFRSSGQWLESIRPGQFFQ
jgi:hypothetical protein